MNTVLQGRAVIGRRIRWYSFTSGNLYRLRRKVRFIWLISTLQRKKRRFVSSYRPRLMVRYYTAKVSGKWYVYDYDDYFRCMMYKPVAGPFRTEKQADAWAEPRCKTGYRHIS